MSISISIGTWGGFYIRNKYTKQLCLGWICVTFWPCDVDQLVAKLVKRYKEPV